MTDNQQHMAANKQHGKRTKNPWPVIHIVVSMWMMVMVFTTSTGYGQGVSVVVLPQMEVGFEQDRFVDSFMAKAVSEGDLQILPYSSSYRLNRNVRIQESWQTISYEAGRHSGIGEFVRSNKYLVAGIGVATVTIVAILVSSGGGTGGGGELPVTPQPDPLPLPAGRP